MADQEVGDGIDGKVMSKERRGNGGAYRALIPKQSEATPCFQMANRITGDRLEYHPHSKPPTKPKEQCLTERVGHWLGSA
ncbi:MAG: hypothetical protein JWO30_4344 [Fibrobacteres bacterium]|nr:hypothetical protein [Fibrobacterota bacterium]